nr:MAG TPA_asm: hypothetical protein [Caudoviricetes sp.]
MRIFLLSICSDSPSPFCDYYTENAVFKLLEKWLLIFKSYNRYNSIIIEHNMGCNRARSI